MFRINKAISKLPVKPKPVVPSNQKRTGKAKIGLVGKINDYLKDCLKVNCGDEDIKEDIPRKSHASPEIIKSMKNEVKEIRDCLSFTEALFPNRNSADILSTYWRSKAYLENAERIVASVEFLYKKIALLEQQEIVKNKDS